MPVSEWVVWTGVRRPMGRLRDKQWGWEDLLLLAVVLGLTVFLVPLFVIYVIAHPAPATMAVAFGVDLAGWIVAGVVGSLAWSIWGTRRIAVCGNCGRVNVVPEDGFTVCQGCKAPV